VYAGVDSQIFASTFMGNSALCIYGGSCSDADGGGLYNSGGNLTLTNVIFQSNQAGRMGGGMGSEYNSPVLFNVTFSGNKAGWGGGLYHDHGSPRLTNVLFSGNLAGWGGGMISSRNTPTLTHVTFSGNRATNVGGGLDNYGGAPIVINSVLWGNSAANGPQIYNDAPNPVITVTYSNIQFTGVYTGVGNINADPQFALALAASAAPTTTGNFQLQPRSPAIDSGTDAGVTTDLAGFPRPIGKGYDMGAYEFQPRIYLPLVLRN
jgi:hypothetical protein